jgi:hypothetical protein
VDNSVSINGQYEAKGKRFALFTLPELRGYYCRRTNFDRHLYESLRSGTPYKPVFDLDRTVGSEEELHRLNVAFTMVFMPLLASFFTTLLKREVGTSDFRCLDASQSDRKFSKHMMLHVTDEKGRAFAYHDRLQEVAVMARFRVFCEEQASDSKDLLEFYYFHHRGDIATIVDYSIYHQGKRDMRIIGSCKASRKSKSAGLRALLPTAPDLPMCHYLCNMFGADTVAIGGVDTPLTPKKRRKRTRRPPAKRAIEATATATHSLEPLGYAEASNHVLLPVFRAAGGIVPDPTYKWRRCEDGGCNVVMPLNFSPGEDGVRRCLLKVAHSRHWAEIRGALSAGGSVRSVRYYCHGCAQSLSLFESETDIERRLEEAGPAKDSASFAQQRPFWMHTQLASRFLPALKIPARGGTLVLKSGMGTGKTKVIGDFLRGLPDDATVLCIGYRRVLNTALAAAFGLMDYQDVAKPDMPKARRLCVQIDSLPRLLLKRGGGGHELRSAFDVVVIDEAESCLSHFAAETLEHKVLVCWKLFAVLVQKANLVIFADADAGQRTTAVVRELRDDSTTHFVENQCTVSAGAMCDTFVWMPSLGSFLAKACDILFRERGPVYVASNSKGFAHAFVALVLDRADILQATGGEGDFTREDVLIIDRDIPEAHKRQVKECNTAWLRYRLVVCTPTVGAGIDFHIPNYFHSTFVYATDLSTTPREVNQQRGRVRCPLHKKCYLLIDMHQRKRLPDTTAECQDLLQRSGGAVVEDMTTYQTTDATPGWLGVRLTKTPSLLLHLFAMHVAERNRSSNNMGLELHLLLKEKCPDANHVMLGGALTGTAEQRAHAAALRYKVAHATALANQPVLSDETARELNMQVITAQDQDCPTAKKQLHMHFLRGFYSGHCNMSATDILTICHEAHIKRVKYAGVLLMPAGCDQADKRWAAFDVDGAAMFSLAHRAALHCQEPAHVSQTFFALLLFLAGMWSPGLQITAQTDNIAVCRAFFAPGAEFHSALSSQRISNHPKQLLLLWHKNLMDPSPVEPKVARARVRRLLQRVLRDKIGIALRTGGDHKHYADSDGNRLSTLSDYCSRSTPETEGLIGLLDCVRAHAVGLPVGWFAAEMVLQHTAGCSLPVECGVKGVGLEPLPARRVRKPSRQSKEGGVRDCGAKCLEAIKTARSCL